MAVTMHMKALKMKPIHQAPTHRGSPGSVSNLKHKICTYFTLPSFLFSVLLHFLLHCVGYHDTVVGC